MFDDFSRFEAHLPVDPPASINELPKQLQIYADHNLSIWYSPMGDRPSNTKLWILGITPGWNQMRIAYAEAAGAIASGMTRSAAAKMRKPSVAFAGSMRTNLVAMLDELGLDRTLDVPSSAALFDSDLLRTGSVLKYPVFTSSVANKNKNYTGHSPKPLGQPVLKEMIDTVFAEELAANTTSLILPLGKAVEEMLCYCVDQGRLDQQRVLRGFPHPSGANGHRLKHFAQHKAALANQISLWFC